VEIVDRERVNLGTAPKEIVTYRNDEGALVRVLCKYTAPETHFSHGARGSRAYEARVYRTVVDRLPLTTPRLIAVQPDPPDDDACLVIEVIDGRRLNTSESLVCAAGWCGTFHAFGDELLAAQPDLPLARHDVDYYVDWARRTEEFADELPAGSYPWLGELCRRYPEAIERLFDSPSTVIHGEFYPHNIVVTWDDGRIYPVDWEGAAIAPGVFDITTLTQGWPDEDADASFDAYCAARWPAGRPAGFGEMLDTAHIHTILRWMGDRREWTAKTAHYLPRLQAIATRLGLL
jgi:hypothetical protein